MADGIKFSDLEEVTSLDGSEVIPIVKDGENKIVRTSLLGSSSGDSSNGMLRRTLIEKGYSESALDDLEVCLRQDTKDLTDKNIIPFIDSAYTSDRTPFNYFYEYCYNLLLAPELDSSNATSFQGMFKDCWSLKIAPMLDLSKATDTRSMFAQCYSLRSIPQYDLSAVLRGDSMFVNCRTLTSVPYLNLGKATNLNRLFSHDKQLTTVDGIDTSSCVNFDYMFEDCAIIDAPEIDTSKATSINGIFTNCTKMVSAPAVNAANCTQMINVLSGCTSLENFGGFIGAKVAFAIDNSKKLTHDSLLNVLNGLATVESSQTLNIARQSVALLSEDELAIATNKNWTLAQY